MGNFYGDTIKTPSAENTLDEIRDKREIVLRFMEEKRKKKEKKKTTHVNQMFSQIR